VVNGPSGKRRLLIAAVAVAVLGTGVAVIPSLLTPGEAPTSPVELSTEVRAAAAAAAASEEELREALVAQIAAEPGSYSVTVRELDGAQRQVSIDGELEHDPASMIKTFYAYAALHRVQQGELNLDVALPSGVTLGDCLGVMIETSDNNCMADIREFLGNEALNTFFAEQGFPGTYTISDEAGVYVNKRTTTDDLAELLARLENGELLDEEHGDILLSHLLRQAWRSKISSGLPEGVPSATKSGYRPFDDGTAVEGDSAIVYAPDGTYVLAVIGTGVTSPEAVRAISTTVYAHLSDTEVTPWIYPAQQYLATTDVPYAREPGGSAVGVIPAGTLVELMYSDRVWFRLYDTNRYIWVLGSQLTLRPEYDYSTVISG